MNSKMTSSRSNIQGLSQNASRPSETKISKFQSSYSILPEKEE